MSYVSDVAELFLSRCQSVKILSPTDYATIAEWEKQEIPLAVILDSLNRSFNALPEHKKTSKIESMNYFQNEIKKNFANWLQNYKIDG
jgi:hypothetical protein